MDSPVTDHDKARKASRFLKADAVPSELCHWCFFFFFFLRPQLEVSVRMSVDYEAEKGTVLRESVQLTPVDQMMKPLSIESWRNTRGCSASEVKFLKDPPIASGQHAMQPNTQCAFKQDCRKSKAILVGLRSCR